MQQNTLVLKLFNKMSMFLKIKICVKLKILKIEFYVYFQVKLNISNIEFHLNFQKNKIK